MTNLQRTMMEEPPVVQEDVPGSLPLHCVLKDNDLSTTGWQDLSLKFSSTSNPKLLFLTVEYVQNVNTNELEFGNYSPSISESESLSPFDSHVPSSHMSSLLNTLVITANGQSQFQNSLVVLPTPRNNSQQINVLVDESETHLIVGSEKIDHAKEVRTNNKLNPGTSQLIINSTGVNCDEHVSSPDKELISTSTADISEQEPQENSSGPNNDFIGDSASLFPGCNIMQNQFPIEMHNGSILLNNADEIPTNEKTHLDQSLVSKYETNCGHLKTDELLLTDSEQSTELLMKSEGLMEVDSYTLSQTEFVTPEDGTTYPTAREQLNINGIEKVENEYLMAEAIEFEDPETNLLQSNLEVFTSHTLDTNGLLFYDKTRLRPGNRNPVENLGLDYWCENCEFGVKCGRHEVKIISDKPVLSRARATLPKELLAINKLRADGNEEGVFARKTIMRRVQFGPVEGRLVKDWVNTRKTVSSEIELLLEVETGELLKLDVSDEHETNWMRFVRKAKTIKEQNLILSQQGKSLYFTTTRVIPPRHELKVGYSPQYAERRHLKVLDDLSWNCFECTAIFSSPDELQKHLIGHENEKIQTPVNEKKNKGESNPGREHVSDANSVKAPVRNRNQNHRLKSTKENECRSCHKVFPRSYSLKRHLLLVHSSEKDKENSVALKNLNDKVPITNTLFKKKLSGGSRNEWLCTHCNLTFDNPSVLNLHTLTHAAEDLESEAVLGLPSELSSVYHEGEFLIENGDIQCPQCTQEFSSKRELINHVSTHGKINMKKCYINPSKPCKCDRCYKSFANIIRLQKHMLVHGSEESKPYQCGTCFKRFLNNSALACHLKTHNDKKCFECPICKKEFKQVFGLKEHVKIHSADGYFTCPHCNKVFDGYSVVRKHIRAFHSGHQHVCKDCGKLCPTVDKLRMHSLKHSDHREFLCANCGKQFKRKDKLKEHMKRLHSAEREMKLLSLALRIPNTKDRRFTTKMSPMTYDRFIYKCRNCMVGFKRRGMLVNHLAKRHPDVVPNTVPELNLPILKTTRDYFCQYCDKIYKSSSKRKAHILKNHPGAELPMSNRQKGGIPNIPGMPNPTFSQTVGSVKTTPHGCKWCHKQYASKAKLLQHQRKKHASLLQQVADPVKNPCSPVDSKREASSGVQHKVENYKEVTGNNENQNCSRILQSDVGILKGDFNINGELRQDVDGTYKKNDVKTLHENIPCEFLHQAMTELNQSLSEYKLSFAGTQENLFKIMELKDGGECVRRQEDCMPAAQMTRTWPDLSPYPPR